MEKIKDMTPSDVQYNQFHTVMFTLNQKERVYHNFIKSQKPGLAEMGIKIFVMLLIVEMVLSPLVNMINHSLYLSKMTNKLYHGKKAELVTVQKKKLKKQKGEKDQTTLARENMNERESLKITWFNVLLFRYLKCNCYRKCHKEKTLKFY